MLRRLSTLVGCAAAAVLLGVALRDLVRGAGDLTAEIAVVAFAALLALCLAIGRWLGGIDRGGR